MASKENFFNVYNSVMCLTPVNNKAHALKKAGVHFE